MTVLFINIELGLNAIYGYHSAMVISQDVLTTCPRPRTWSLNSNPNEPQKERERGRIEPGSIKKLQIRRTIRYAMTPLFLRNLCFVFLHSKEEYSAGGIQKTM